MDRRVLPDLERGEVEPERPDLPAQLGDIAPGDPLEPIGDERVGDLDQLGVRSRADSYRPVSGAGSPTSAARVRRSRSAMNPNRWRYGSSGSVDEAGGRSREVFGVAGRREASARETCSAGTATATVCISRVATAS